jgi:trans-aconitate methyltransferase
MERVPEPELMNDPAQARAYADADFAAPHDSVVAWLAARFPDASPRRVLDLGCGPGDVTWRVARLWPDALVVGIDGALAMLREGRRLLATRAPDARISLAAGYLPEVPIRPAAIDAVVSNSLLHHLADPSVLWSSLCACASPGAVVLVYDLHRPPTRAAAEELVATYASAEPEVLQRDFLHSLCAAYTVDEVRAQLRSAGLEGLEVAAVGDRHLAVWGRFAPRTDAAAGSRAM